MMTPPSTTRRVGKSTGAAAAAAAASPLLVSTVRFLLLAVLLSGGRRGTPPTVLADDAAVDADADAAVMTIDVDEEEGPENAPNHQQEGRARPIIASDPDRPAGSLSIREVNGLIFSEIVEEFGLRQGRDDDNNGDGRQLLSDEEVDLLWEDAVSREWERAHRRESVAIMRLRRQRHLEEDDTDASDAGEYEYAIDSDPSARSAFVACCLETDVSGNVCRHTVQNQVGGKARARLSPLYNRRDKTCYMSYMRASVAALTRWPLRVMPVLPEMKITEGTVREILEESVETYRGKSQVCFRVSMCQGAEGESMEDTERMGREMLDDALQQEEGARDSDDDDRRGRALRTAEAFLRIDGGGNGNGVGGGEDAAERIRSIRSKLPRNLLWQQTLGVMSSHRDANHRNRGGEINGQCLSDLRERTGVESTPSGDALRVCVSLRPDDEDEDQGFKVFDEDDDVGLLPRSCLLSLLPGVSRYHAVCNVDLDRDMKPLNLQAQKLSQNKGRDPNNKGPDRPFFELGLRGQGQVVGVSDTGIAANNCYFWDRDNEADMSESVLKKNRGKTMMTPNFKRRKIVQHVPFADHEELKSGESAGHGTHVAATIAGRKAENGRDELETGYGDGVARDARIAFFDLFNGGKFAPPAGITEIFDAAKKANAKVHSVSWASTSNVYGPVDLSFDAWIRDNDDHTVVVAAGNTGYSSTKGIDLPNTVGSPALAKNVISVGASQSKKGSYDCKDWMLGEDYLGYFSSRGPSADGRKKPEIVATGFYVLSASPNGECDRTNKETGKMEGVEWKYGTSMAAAVVSGSCALIYQYFEEGFYPTGRRDPGNARSPSSMLVKAVVLNGAQDLIGVQNSMGTDTVPPRVTPLKPYDNGQGFGSLSLMNSLPLKGYNTILAYVKDRKVIRDNEEDSFTMRMPNNSDCKAIDMSTTLVWHDPVTAVPSCKMCVQNDLNLSVIETKTGRVYYPNGLNRPDYTHNAERVRLRANTGQKFRVKVTAMDLVTSSQKWALIVTARCLQ